MSNDAKFESFEKELNRLVESFGNRLAELKSTDYNEAKLRDDFLNPFFRALGWDMENRASLIQKEREVEIESATQIGGGRKRADYLFRTDKRDRFVCEAKKPVEDFTEEEQQSLRSLAAGEDDWSKFMKDLHSDLSKLPEQDFANSSLAQELNEIQTELKMAADALLKKSADIAVPLTHVPQNDKFQIYISLGQAF